MNQPVCATVLTPAEPTLADLMRAEYHTQREINALLASIADRLEPLQQALQEIKTLINERATSAARQKFLDAKKDTGTVNFELEGVEVKAVIKKTVKWDQKVLAAIAERIQLAGDNPHQYMTLEYKVHEKSYTAWPDAIKNVFAPAREVKPGMPVFELTPKEPLF